MAERSMSGAHIYGASFPVKSRLARRGVIKVRTTAIAADNITATVHTRRGPLGWYARRYLARHPLQFIWQAKTLDDPDWVEHSASVKVL